MGNFVWALQHLLKGEPIRRGSWASDAVLRVGDPSSMHVSLEDLILANDWELVAPAVPVTVLDRLRALTQEQKRLLATTTELLLDVEERVRDLRRPEDEAVRPTVKPGEGESVTLHGESGPQTLVGDARVPRDFALPANENAGTRAGDTFSFDVALNLMLRGVKVARVGYATGNFLRIVDGHVVRPDGARHFVHDSEVLASDWLLAKEEPAKESA